MPGAAAKAAAQRASAGAPAAGRPRPKAVSAALSSPGVTGATGAVLPSSPVVVHGTTGQLAPAVLPEILDALRQLIGTSVGQLAAARVPLVPAAAAVPAPGPTPAPTLAPVPSVAATLPAAATVALAPLSAVPASAVMSPEFAAGLAAAEAARRNLQATEAALVGILARGQLPAGAGALAATWASTPAPQPTMLALPAGASWAPSPRPAAQQLDHYYSNCGARCAAPPPPGASFRGFDCSAQALTGTLDPSPPRPLRGSDR